MERKKKNYYILLYNYYMYIFLLGALLKINQCLKNINLTNK